MFSNDDTLISDGWKGRMEDLRVNDMNDSVGY